MINRFEGIILRGPTDPLDEILDDIFSNSLIQYLLNLLLVFGVFEVGHRKE